MSTSKLPIKRTLITCLLAIVISNSHAQSTYHFFYESQLTAQLGAHNILAFNRGLIYLDNQYIPNSFFNEKKVLGKIGGISYRASKLFLIHYPISYLLSIYQHEFFGHIARARQVGFGKTRIEMGLPPPFMSIGAVAYWSNGTQPITNQERLMPFLGGVEANNILANISRSQMLQNDYIHYQEGFLYLTSSINLPSYILFSRASSLNDIDNYIQRINGYYASTGKAIQKDQLKIYAWLDFFLDPIMMYSAYAIAKDYLYDGHATGKIWWIPLGKKVQYLPMFQLGLTPYGAELYYENNIKIDKRLLTLTIRHSDNVLSEAFGVDVNAHNILNHKNRIRIDACLAFWSQPSFIVKGNSTPINDGNSFGMGFTTNFHINLLPATLADYSASIFAQLGYKTGGYWQGEILDEAFLWRLGLSYRLKPIKAKTYIIQLKKTEKR